MENEHSGHGPVTTCAFLRRECPFSLGPPSLQLIYDRVRGVVKYEDGRYKSTFGYCVGRDGDYTGGSEAPWFKDEKPVSNGFVRFSAKTRASVTFCYVYSRL